MCSIKILQTTQKSVQLYISNLDDKISLNIMNVYIYLSSFIQINVNIWLSKKI